MRNIKVCIYTPRIWLNGTYNAVLAFAKRLNTMCDIDIVYDKYNKNDAVLVDELSKYANIIEYYPNYKCDVCINVTLTNPPANLIADKYIQWFHSDVSALNTKFKPDTRFSEYVVVSEYAKGATDAYYDINSHVIHCDLNIDDNVGSIHDNGEYDLKLVTASRIHPDKGFDDAILLASKLKENSIKFKWYILGYKMDSLYASRIKERFRKYSEVVFIHSCNDPYPYIKWADYGVLFSKRETWGLFINECLAMNTPVIVKDIPVIHEQVIHGENGYIFSDSIDIDLIMNIPKIEYNKKEHYTKWFPILGIDGKKEE